MKDSNTPKYSDSPLRLMTWARALTLVSALAFCMTACGKQSSDNQSATDGTNVFLDGDSGPAGPGGRINRCESQADLLRAKAQQKGGMASDEYGEYVQKSAECRALKAETFKTRGS